MKFSKNLVLPAAMFTFCTWATAKNILLVTLKNVFQIFGLMDLEKTGKRLRFMFMAVFYGLQEGRCLRELLQLITATICIRDSKSLDSTFDVILESKCLYARNSVIKKITQYKKNLMRKLYCFVLLEFQEKLPECTY